VAEEAAADELDILHDYSNNTLKSRHEVLVRRISHMKYENIDLSVVRTWMSQNPFSNIQSKKTISRKSSDDEACKTFMRAYRGSSSKITNPDTGKKINKKGKNGEPTALIKKLLERCKPGSRGSSGKVASRKSVSKPCRDFLKEMENNSPLVINPLTGNVISKRDAKGKPTALIKKLLERCKPSGKAASRKSSMTGPCGVFLKAMQTSSPTLINPLTGKRINKRDANGKPTALIKKIQERCK
jgi:hypothetical protein